MNITPQIEQYDRMRTAVEALTAEQARQCLAYLVECLFPIPDKEHSAEGIRGIIRDSAQHIREGWEMPKTPAPAPEQEPTNKQIADGLRLLAHDEPRPERPELMRRAAERLEKTAAPAPSLRQERTEPTPYYTFPTDDLSEALPNLDAINEPDELNHYAEEFQRIARVFERLELYAQNKALAVKHRLAGNIQSAQNAEDHADLAYNLLPQWARW